MQEETQEGVQENIGENSRQEEEIKNRETETSAGAFAERSSDDEPRGTRRVVGCYTFDRVKIFGSDLLGSHSRSRLSLAPWTHAKLHAHILRRPSG